MPLTTYDTGYWGIAVTCAQGRPAEALFSARLSFCSPIFAINTSPQCLRNTALASAFGDEQRGTYPPSGSGLSSQVHPDSPPRVLGGLRVGPSRMDSLNVKLLRPPRESRERDSHFVLLSRFSSFVAEIQQLTPSRGNRQQGFSPQH
jgi:hypothetical protein